MALSAARTQWVKDVHAAAVRELLRRGLALLVAWWCALALVSHWARETGWGSSMHGNNVGNIRGGGGWTGPTVTQQGSDDPAGGAPYRAYPTLDEGVAATLALAVDGRRYAPAWVALVASCDRGPYAVRYGDGEASVGADAVTWYAALMRAGWHPYSDASLNDYRGVVQTVARIVGTPPVASPLVVGLSLGGALAGLVWLAEKFIGWRVAPLVAGA